MLKKLEEAKANIEIVIANTKMTRQEHVVLQQNIELLYSNAKENVEGKQSKKEVE